MRRDNARYLAFRIWRLEFGNQMSEVRGRRSEKS